jgi:hypothetical protein
MLTVTKDAATLIRALAEKAGAPSQSGLRIVVDPLHNSLSMSLAACAAPGDEVAVSGDTPVYMSSAASQRLTMRTLHADTSETRSSFFLPS